MSNRHIDRTCPHCGENLATDGKGLVWCTGDQCGHSEGKPAKKVKEWTKVKTPKNAEPTDF